MKIYKSLKTEFKPEYGVFTPDEIQERVDSEDWFTHCRGYPLTQTENKVDKMCPRAERIIK